MKKLNKIQDKISKKLRKIRKLQDQVYWLCRERDEIRSRNSCNSSTDVI